MGKRTFKILFVTAGVVLAMLGSSRLVWGAFDKQQTCPVMPGRPVKEKFFVDYNGQRIYLCCASCVKAFKKHPEKYIAKMEPEPFGGNKIAEHRRASVHG